MKKISFILLFGLSLSLFAQQSSQYTQYSFNNFGYNPAFAGSTKCIDFRAGRRSQWRGFDGAPQTMFASFHKRLGRKHFKNKGFHAVGLYLEQDRIHLTSRTYLKGAYAYHKQITTKYTLSLGVFIGIQQYSIDNVFGPNNADPVLAAAGGSSLRYPDIMPGILLYSKKVYWSFSVNQLYFKNINLGLDQTQVNQYILGAGHKSNVNDWTFFKSFLLKWNVMGPPSVDLNTAFIYRQNISFGLGYRIGDAANANIKFKLFNAFSVGYAFDFPLTRMFGNYGHEVIIAFSPCGDDGTAGGAPPQKDCAAYY